MKSLNLTALAFFEDLLLLLAIYRSFDRILIGKRK